MRFYRPANDDYDGKDTDSYFYCQSISPPYQTVK